MLAQVFSAAALIIGPMTIDVDDDGRFRLTVAYDDTESPREVAQAMLMLENAAQNICDRYDADAVSGDEIQLGEAEPLRGDREAISMTIEYVCVIRQAD